jgi:hypothetical protein
MVAVPNDLTDAEISAFNDELLKQILVSNLCGDGTSGSHC